MTHKENDYGYNQAINQFVVAFVLNSIEIKDEQFFDSDRLNKEVNDIEEFIELVSDIFDKSVDQVEEDINDVLEHTPMEDLHVSADLRRRGKLN